MAKNLKLNIKNAQLAEALKLNLPKKPSSSKKTQDAPANEPVETPLVQPTVEAAAVPPAPVQPKKEDVKAVPVEQHVQEKPLEKAPEKQASVAP